MTNRRNILILLLLAALSFATTDAVRHTRVRGAHRYTTDVDEIVSSRRWRRRAQDNKNNKNENDGGDDNDGKNDNNNKNNNNKESLAPSGVPSVAPTMRPTRSPIVVTPAPTTAEPTTRSPIATPTQSPVQAPTQQPSPEITAAPIARTESPTADATKAPTVPVAPTAPPLSTLSPTTPSTTVPTNKPSTTLPPTILIETNTTTTATTSPTAFTITLRNFTVVLETTMDSYTLRTTLEDYLRVGMILDQDVQSVDLVTWQQQQQNQTTFQLGGTAQFVSAINASDVHAEQDALLTEEALMETVLTAAVGEPVTVQKVYVGTLDGPTDNDDVSRAVTLDSDSSGSNSILLGSVVGVVAISVVGGIVMYRYRLIKNHR